MVDTQLDPELESVVAARHLLVAAAGAWRLPEAIIDNAALVASELVTNAVLHAGTRFGFSASRLGSGLRIEVSDSDDRLPPTGVARPEDLLATRSMTGRGLALVAATADRWGYESLPSGKVVWAEVGTGRRRVEPASPPAFPPAPEPPRIAASAVAAGVKEVTVASGSGRPVHLIGVPVSLLVESARHLTDLHREMRVIGLDQSGPKELVDLARSTTEIEAGIGHLREAGLSEAEKAMAEGAQVVDVDLLVPDDTAKHLDRLGRLLNRARTRLARNHLLTLPASSDVVAFRLWWREEVLAQLAGRPPTPCPIRPAGRGSVAGRDERRR